MDASRLIYSLPGGKALMGLLSWRPLSQAVGHFLDTKASRFLIGPFVRASHIRLEDYETEGIDSFNAFFTRRIKKGLRPVREEEEILIAPCDGLLRVYEAKEDLVLPVKEVPYRLSSLLRSQRLADRYRGGLVLVYRLCVHHYHRYAYVDSGRKSRNVFLKGALHTVRPSALQRRPVFAENCREYTLIESPRLGTLLQMEVGAMFVGRIRNRLRGEGYVCRGEEKGCFEYGGSTVIVLVQPGRVKILPEILEASGRGEELEVRLGQAVGRAARSGREAP